MYKILIMLGIALNTIVCIVSAAPYPQLKYNRSKPVTPRPGRLINNEPPTPALEFHDCLDRCARSNATMNSSDLVACATQCSALAQRVRVASPSYDDNANKTDWMAPTCIDDTEFNKTVDNILTVVAARVEFPEQQAHLLHALRTLDCNKRCQDDGTCVLSYRKLTPRKPMHKGDMDYMIDSMHSWHPLLKSASSPLSERTPPRLSDLVTVGTCLKKCNGDKNKQLICYFSCIGVSPKIERSEADDCTRCLEFSAP